MWSLDFNSIIYARDRKTLRQTFAPWGESIYLFSKIRCSLTYLPTYLKIWCHIWMLSEPISNFVFIILSGNFLTERTILSWLMASRLSCETQSFVTLTFSIITLAKWAFQMTTNGPFHCLQREFWSFFFYSIHFSRPKLNVSCKKGFVQNWVWSWSTKLERMFFLENFNARDMGALNIKYHLRIF